MVEHSRAFGVSQEEEEEMWGGNGSVIVGWGWKGCVWGGVGMGNWYQGKKIPCWNTSLLPATVNAPSPTSQHMCTHTLAPRPKLTGPAPTRLLVLGVWPAWWMSGPPTTQTPLCCLCDPAALAGPCPLSLKRTAMPRQAAVKGISIFWEKWGRKFPWQAHDYLEVHHLNSLHLSICASGLTEHFELITWAINAMGLITLKLHENDIMNARVAGATKRTSTACESCCCESFGTWHQQQTVKIRKTFFFFPHF